MSSLDTYPTSPGSYDEFMERQGLIHGVEAIQSHSDALLQFRMALAAFHGITLEQLHANQFGTPEQAEAA